METFKEFLDQQHHQPQPAIQQPDLDQWRWLEKRWKDLPQENRLHVIQYVRGIVGDEPK